MTIQPADDAATPDSIRRSLRRRGPDARSCSAPGPGTGRASTARCRRARRRRVRQGRLGPLRRRRQPLPHALCPRRNPAARRRTPDVLSLRIHELPTARGCTYVLGREDFAWALSLGRTPQKPSGCWPGWAWTAAKSRCSKSRSCTPSPRPKARWTPSSSRTCWAIRSGTSARRAKRRAPPPPCPRPWASCRQTAGSGACPSTAAWTSSATPTPCGSLPPALGHGRRPRPQLIGRYLGWTGGATLKQSQWFTGFTVAHSKAALADVGAVETVPPPTVRCSGCCPTTSSASPRSTQPEEEQIQLLAGTDSLVLLRRNSADLFAEEDRDKKVLDSTLALQADLPDHPILDRGRIIGLWQYDPGQGGSRTGSSTAPLPQRSSASPRWRPGSGTSWAISAPSAWTRRPSRQDRIDALDAANG